MASRVLQGLPLDLLTNKTLLRDLLQGLLPRVWVDVLLQHIDEFPAALGVDVYRVLQDYHQDEATRAAVQTQLEEGRTDVVRSLCRQIEALLRGPELGKLVDESAIRLDSFESFLEDIPGDHRDSLQIEFSRNPAATRLLSVQPDDVLRDYRGGPIERQVEEWLCEPVRSHRLLTLVNSLRHHVENVPDIFQFRMDRHAMVCLGYFLRQVGPELTEELRESLERRNVEPIYPRT
jgi:hypothetical protein